MRGPSSAPGRSSALAPALPAPSNQAQGSCETPRDAGARPAVRVAQVTSYFEPHLGGVETHVRELSRALKRRGVDITVITADTEGAGPRSEVGGIEVIRVPPRSMVFKTPSMRDAVEAVVGGKFDLVHSHTPPPL